MATLQTNDPYGLNVILTKNEQENIKFWNIRESIPLAEKKENFVIKHDVSIPLERMEQFINETDQKLKKNFSAEIINFGHIGDNNLHYNVSVSKNMKPNEEKRVLKKVNDIDKDLKNINVKGTTEFGKGGMNTKIEAAKICNLAGCDMIIASGLYLNPIDQIEKKK